MPDAPTIQFLLLHPGTIPDEAYDVVWCLACDVDIYEADNPMLLRISDIDRADWPLYTHLHGKDTADIAKEYLTGIRQQMIDAGVGAAFFVAAEIYQTFKPL